MSCVCGHVPGQHDFTEGCLKFVCCNKTRILTPGRRHTEHDGANHKAQPCPCRIFSEGERTA